MFTTYSTNILTIATTIITTILVLSTTIIMIRIIVAIDIITLIAEYERIFLIVRVSMNTAGSTLGVAFLTINTTS